MCDIIISGDDWQNELVAKILERDGKEYVPLEEFQPSHRKRPKISPLYPMLEPFAVGVEETGGKG